MIRGAFNLTFDCKRWFFDEARVLAMVTPRMRDFLASSGAFAMTVARRSMRYVTSVREQQRQKRAGERRRITGEKALSAPRTPPHAVQPHPWLRGETGTRYGVFFALDPQRASVVIGPNLMPGRPYNLPHLHEFGGRVRVKNPRRSVRKVGSSGEVRIGGRPARTSHFGYDRLGRPVMVTYARLRTGAQVARANILNESLYGPSSYMATYPARPYMGPALAKTRPMLKKFWAESVRAVPAAAG